MNKVPNSERKHIAFIGRRNVGKSSLINALTGQDISIVSTTPGTTTDPVKKAIELLPYGPVVLVDTAGIDDVGELGQQRITKTFKIISSIDLAIVVLDARERLSTEEIELFIYLDSIKVPYILAVNKIELGVNPLLLEDIKDFNTVHYEISVKEKVGIDELRTKIIRALPRDDDNSLIGDLVQPGDVVVMVVPIDLGAPKGRLILPQVQTIREALDEDAVVIVAKDRELKEALDKLKNPPDLVITDSQAIMKVAAIVPASVKLTTFSIIMARYKGDLPAFVQGLKRVDELKDGDKILIAEACSHHAQSDDIGRIKIPKWLREYTHKNLEFEVYSGLDFPEDVSKYKMIIHCGGCMMTRQVMQKRIKEVKLLNIPIVNYGVLISYLHGAMPRTIEPFEEAVTTWKKLVSLN